LHSLLSFTGIDICSASHTTEGIYEFYVIRLMDAFSDDEVCHLNRAMNGLKR